MKLQSVGAWIVGFSLGAALLSCGAEDQKAEPVGTKRSALAAWANGNFSQVLRVNPGETTVRNICELTLPLNTMKPLAITASGAGGGSPPSLSVGWTGSAVSASGLSVNGCSSFPCEVIARWRHTAGNGTALGCNVAMDDGVGQLVGSSSGTTLTVAAAPTSSVIFNHDVKVGPSGTSIASSCVLRQSAQLVQAEVTDFEVFVDGIGVVTLPGPIPIGAAAWSANGPAIPFGSIYVGSALDATRLKHVAPRKEQLSEGDALRCSGQFHSQNGLPVFDVNVTNPPSGNGVALSGAATGWTCSPAKFGTGDGCDCDCGIVDPDCQVACGCVDGATHCSETGNVEECQSGTWIQTQSCAFGCLGAQCATSVSCTAGTYRCNGNAVEVCNSSGTAYLHSHTCPTACSSGLCTGACTPGERRCNGADVEECGGGAAWSVVQTCSTRCDGASRSCALPSLDVALNTSLDGEIVVDGAAVIRAGAVLTSPSGNLSIRATSITVESGASIVVSPTGTNPAGTGGSGTCCSCGGSGGGYGTQGNFSLCGLVTPGQAFGSSSDATVEQGARGGNGVGGTLGGMGGGVLRLIADTINVAGQVTANGAQGAAGGGLGGGGGGSGGGILIAASSLTITGVVSAAGGSGGSGNSAGGSGGQGRVKLLYGQTGTVTGTTTGVKTQGLMPPLIMSSTTHPDPNLFYNDDFPLIAVTWARPFPSLQGYYHRTNTQPVSVPTPANGSFIPSELVSIDRSQVVQGSNYFHIVPVDATSNVGLVENQFRIRVNTTPPTVSSPSHPNQNTWYANSNVFFSWTVPNGDANYLGTHYAFDHYGNTVPTTANTFLPVSQKQLLVTGVANGVWAFHIISVDQRGYRTKTAGHYLVRIGSDPGQGMVQGTVTGAGEPVVGATVSLNRALLAPDQTTPASGTFSYPNIASGTWEVQVSKSGFLTQTQQVVVTTGASTVANFALVPEP